MDFQHIYRIESIFYLKQQILKLKPNFPLTFFFGDNSNAIEIQVWCALIALLLLDVTHKDYSQLCLSLF